MAHKKFVKYCVCLIFQAKFNSNCEWHDQFVPLTYQLSMMVGKCANRRAYTPPERWKYTLFQAEITTTKVHFGQFPSRLKFTMTWGASKNSLGVCKRCSQTTTNLYIGYNFKCYSKWMIKSTGQFQIRHAKRCENLFVLIFWSWCSFQILYTLMLSVLSANVRTRYS